MAWVAWGLEWFMGYQVRNVWRMIDCGVMWQGLSRWNSSKACYREECGDAHIPLSVRLRILNQKDDCDKEWLWRDLPWGHGDVKEGVVSWFQLTFLRRTARLGLAPWRYLHIRLHSMYYLFIAIIPCIPKYKHSASFPVPWHYISLKTSFWKEMR